MYLKRHKYLFEYDVVVSLKRQRNYNWLCWFFNSKTTWSISFIEYHTQLHNNCSFFMINGNNNQIKVTFIFVVWSPFKNPNMENSNLKSQKFSRFWDTAYFRKTNDHKYVFRSILCLNHLTSILVISIIDIGSYQTYYEMIIQPMQRNLLFELFTFLSFRGYMLLILMQCSNIDSLSHHSFFKWKQCVNWLRPTTVSMTI